MMKQNIYFNENLIYLMELNNLSSQDLLDKIGYVTYTKNDVSIVSKWKKGCLPRIEVLIAICDFFGYKLDTMIRTRIEFRESLWKKK